LTISTRKDRIRQLSDARQQDESRWEQRAAYFREQHRRYTAFLIPPGASVLDLGCGNGDLLASLSPSRGVGIDFSEVAVANARTRHPSLEFHQADIESQDWSVGLEVPFDYILISDAIGSLEDIQSFLASLLPLCGPRTRVVVAYYAYFWEPILKALEWLGLKAPTREQNVLSTADIRVLLELAGFEMVKREWRQLVPARLLGIGTLVNRYIATLPGIRRLCLRNYVVARPVAITSRPPQSVTIVVPCRNERGNIEPAVTRLPRFCADIELIYVEGGSKDGTYEEALRVQQVHGGDIDIKVMKQPGKGKADAVFAAFAVARGDVLMILDADLTVPPEQLPKFWRVIESGQAEYVHGTRLVYAMEEEAMRFLNLIANWSFSQIFSWLLNQRFTDTLCGTKVMWRDDYQRLHANRSYFGDFDPFGDFDLIFGAAKLSLKMQEIPIRYAQRTYGETQISRFRHGLMLLRMVVFAFRKLKAF
jgi:SAM-dependent methyltransferase